MNLYVRISLWVLERAILVVVLAYEQQFQNVNSIEILLISANHKCYKNIYNSLIYMKSRLHISTLLLCDIQRRLCHCAE
jgi:hypothetical protein